MAGYFAVALDNNTFDASLTYHRLDDSYQVQRIVTNRGRAVEFDHTEPGVATVSLIDTDGSFDPTNTGGTFYGRLEPNKPAQVCLQNPADSSWNPVYTGFVRSISWQPYLNERFANVEIELVDGAGLISAAELTQGAGFGTTPYNAGDVYYPAGTVTTAVQTRINQVLDEVGWPSGTLHRQVFTGNVALQETTYSPRTSAISVIQDAADAEFPGVANFFITRDGLAAFRGRFAKFNPASVSSGTNWNYTAWEAGDRTAAAADPGDVVLVSPPLVVYRDTENLFTAAICTPQNIDDADYEGQYVESGSISAYGLRTWSAENLLTDGGSLSGTATTALEECLKFANYYVTNYASPKTRVGQVTFRPQPGAHSAASWNLLCGVDIGDSVTLTTTHSGGGGFSADGFFVEGISYVIDLPDGSGVPDVTLSLDLSPDSYYADNPFD